MHSVRIVRVRLLALPIACCLAVAGCGSSSGSGPGSSSAPISGSAPATSTATGSSGTPAAGVDAAAVALLPDSVKKKGVLVDGVNLPNPPMEFTTEGSDTPTGLDIDLAAALAARLGLRLTFDKVQFDQLLPGLQTGRDDFVLSALSDTTERQKVADWIDYFNSGDRFFVPAAAADTYKDYASLCGKTVVVGTGTSFVQDVPALSKQVCAGKPSIKVLAIAISGNAGLELQLTTQRAVAAVTGAETFGYLTQTEKGKWAAVGDIFAKSPYGIAVRKGNDGLRAALVKALQGMLADGSYAKILAKWSQSASAIKTVTVNMQSVASS